MRFAPFPTINLVLSNAGELRQQSIHVVWISMENRLSVKWCDVESDLPNSNE
jgi:hypothetical protein